MKIHLIPLAIPLRARDIACALLCAGIISAPASAALAREAGWVPMERATTSLPGAQGLKQAKTRSPAARAPSARKPSARPYATVYDGQPAVNEKEVLNFLDLLPQFRAWTRKSGEEAHPVVNREGKPDFQYSQEAAQWVRDHDFEPARFFCVMGRMAAGLVIVEEGNDFKGTRPPDMPAVAPEELALVRRHLGALLSAGGPPQPIK